MVHVTNFTHRAQLTHAESSPTSMLAYELLPRRDEGYKPAWFVLQIFFLILVIYKYVRRTCRQSCYALARATRYHHCEPQLIRKDISRLDKIPCHIAVILTIRGPHFSGGGVEGLLFDCGEVASWCIGVGSSQLTLYERSGVLTEVGAERIREAVASRLAQYFGDIRLPRFTVTTDAGRTVVGDSDPMLRIDIISEKDGKPAIVELAKTYAGLAAQGALNPSDITLKTVDAELKARVGGEPDLLITFGSELDLQGYPPWHIRVTELFHQPDNGGVVSYQVFSHALRKFSTVKVNLGS